MATVRAIDAFPYTAEILWGECDPEFCPPVQETYSFRTKAELDAFMLGIAEADANSLAIYTVTYDSRESETTSNPVHN